MSRPDPLNPSSPGMDEYASWNVSRQRPISSNLKLMLNPFFRTLDYESQTGTGSHYRSQLTMGESPGGSQGLRSQRTQTPRGIVEPLPGQRGHVRSQNPRRNGVLPSRHVRVPEIPER